MASPLSGLKQLRHAIDLSHPSSAQVTNAHSYTSTHTYALMVWCLITGTLALTVPYTTLLTDTSANEEDAFFKRYRSFRW